jgi:hypothetical protein
MAYTLEALQAQYQGPAMELATALWDKYPIHFPGFATGLVTGDSPQALARDTMSLLEHTPGAWDVFSLAQELSRK